MEHLDMPSFHAAQQQRSSEAAAILLQRRRNGSKGERLPEACRPQNLDQALAIQAEVSAQSGDKIAAWKCGMPGANTVVLAPIYANTVFQEADTCPVWSDQPCARIEPELAFILGRDLPARAESYTVAEIDAAIRETRLALELIGTRYSDPDAATFAEHLADGLFNQGLYLGPVIHTNIHTDIHTDDAANLQTMPIKIKLAGHVLQEFSGVHPAGNPRAPLYWLVEFLRNRSQGLRAGQAIITGSYAGSPDVPLHEDISVSFGQLGELHVRFISKTPA
jgi:2-keto-4-pentenoate hydratase